MLPQAPPQKKEKGEKKMKLISPFSISIVFVYILLNVKTVLF